MLAQGAHHMPENKCTSAVCLESDKNRACNWCRRAPVVSVHTHTCMHSRCTSTLVYFTEQHSASWESLPHTTAQFRSCLDLHCPTSRPGPSLPPQPLPYLCHAIHAIWATNVSSFSAVPILDLDQSAPFLGSLGEVFEKGLMGLWWHTGGYESPCLEESGRAPWRW